MSTRKLREQRRPVCKSDDLTTFIVPKVEKIRSLNLRILKGLLRPVAGKLYLYLLLFKMVRRMLRK
jgi:hypothetical protein